MVTQTDPAEVVEVDPALTEPQTEIVEPPAEPVLPDAAEPTTEAATETPLTASEFDRRWQERENELRQRALEEARDLEQRRRQAEGARAAAEAARQTKLRDAVQVSLMRNLGVSDIDDTAADDIVSRVRGVESSLIEESTEAAINEAITAAAAKAIGYDPGIVSPEAERYVSRFTSYMERLLSHEAVRQHVARDMRRAWEAELPKLVDAEITKRNLKPQPDLRRPNGDGGAIDQSREALLDRVAFGVDKEGNRLTDADRERYRREEQGR